MNYLDEKFNMLKCMDETNSKTIMSNEIVTKWMKYLDEHGTWMNFWLVKCMDESDSKIVMTHGNYWTYLIFMSNFIYEKKYQRWNSKELNYNVIGWNNNLCKLS